MVNARSIHEEIDFLRKRVKEQQAQLARLRKEIEELRKANRQIGFSITPETDKIGFLG